MRVRVGFNIVKPIRSLLTQQSLPLKVRLDTPHGISYYPQVEPGELGRILAKWATGSSYTFSNVSVV